MVVFPLLLETDFFLRIWLGDNFPPYLVIFVQFALLAMLLDALNGPLWVAAQADGRVASYHVILSIIHIGLVLVVYILLNVGYSLLLVPACLIVDNIACTIFRMIYLRKFGFSCFNYIKNCLMPITCIVLCGLIAWICLMRSNSFIIFLLFACFINPVLVSFCGLRGNERQILSQKIRSILQHRFKRNGE